MPSFIRPTYKIVMEDFSSWRPCLGCFHSSRRCSPTADIKDRNLRKRLQKFCRISTLKSSNVPIRSADLWSCPNAGSSSAPLPGSIAAEGSPRIGRISTERRSRSCASPQSASCSENYAIRPEVFGQTLRHGALLVFGAPCQLSLLAGQEHGRTIPLAETKPNELVSFGFGRYLRIMTWSVLLDLDGTLIDSHPGILASCLAALRALGHKPDETLDTRIRKRSSPR